jgi:hypothetical protein
MKKLVHAMMLLELDVVQFPSSLTVKSVAAVTAAIVWPHQPDMAFALVMYKNCPMHDKLVPSCTICTSRFQPREKFWAVIAKLPVFRMVVLPARSCSWRFVLAELLIWPAALNMYVAPLMRDPVSNTGVPKEFKELIKLISDVEFVIVTLLVCEYVQT